MANLPKYCLHKPSGRAVVYLNRTPVYLGRYGSAESRACYDHEIAEWLARGRKPPSGQAKTRVLTVADLAAKYIVWAESYYLKDGRPTDELACIRAAIKDLLAEFKGLPAVEFGPLALKQVRQRMIDRGLCRGNINKQTSRIRRIFKWGAGEELLPMAIADNLRSVEGLKRGRHPGVVERPPVLPVTRAAVMATLEHLDDPFNAVVRFQLCTGCRPGEALIVRPCDIDRTGRQWLYRPESHKMQHYGRDRVIVLNQAAQEILTPLLLRKSDRACFELNGRPASSNAYRLAIQRACRRAFPIPDDLKREKAKTAKAKMERERAIKEWHRSQAWSPNQIRHLCLTEVRAKHGLEAAQAVGGHARADVTQIYAERDLALACRAVEALG